MTRYGKSTEAEKGHSILPSFYSSILPFFLTSILLYFHPSILIARHVFVASAHAHRFHHDPVVQSRPKVYLTMSDTDSLGEPSLGASSTATVASVDGEDSDSIGGPNTG